MIHSPSSTFHVPMSSPDITAAEIEAVAQVLQTPYLSIGPRIAQFEEQFAAYAGARHAVGVSSGTAGLHLCVIAAGIGEGDLVITTPFSFIASANVLLYQRAVPIFVDIDPLTLNLDPGLVEEAAEELASEQGRQRRLLPPALRSSQCSGKLKAILPVHVFGQPADLDLLIACAKRYGLALIEDACEGVGAEYKGRRIGSPPREKDLPWAAVFAFYPNKQMTTGEGGIITTHSQEWDALFRSLRNQGRDVHDAWLNHTRLGYNYRLDELSAALGVVQLSRIEELLESRERVASWYQERLRELEGIDLPFLAATTTRMSWFVYVVRLARGLDRDEIISRLARVGIPSRPYFSPIHLQPFYRRRFGHGPGDFPIAEEMGRRCLALPFSGVLKEEQVDCVCEHLQAAVEELLASKSVRR